MGILEMDVESEVNTASTIMDALLRPSVCKGNAPCLFLLPE